MPLPPPPTCRRVGCDEPPDGRRYINGWLCAGHAPNIPEPDPERTAKALRRQHLTALRGEQD